MPELPEVERGRHMAEIGLVGKRIAAAEIAADPIVFANVDPLDFARALEGKRVISAKRWGKQLWFELDAPPHPLFHFGMSGSFRTQGDDPLRLAAGPNESTDQWPPRFWKILLRADDGTELVMTDARRLGRILLRSSPETQPPIAKLGFDALINPPTSRELAKRLSGRQTPIKSLLLNQSFSAGVGNWIADEVLFQAGIAPTRLASTLDTKETKRLRAKLVGVVRRGAECTVSNQPYPKRWLFHHRWGKQAGAKTTDGDLIEHITVGGRTTAWVPSKQA